MWYNEGVRKSETTVCVFAFPREKGSTHRCKKNYVVIPLTHHKNSGYTELKVFGAYLSPAAGGGKI